MNLKILFQYGFKPSKPILMARVVSSYIRSLASRTPPLHYIDLVTDYRCNLACQHCFAAKLSRPGEEKLTLADYRRVAKEAMNLGAIQFSFQGGEVLLDKRLPAIVKAFSPSANYLAITTNGVLLTEKRIRRLKKWGIDKISVSFDSGIAKEHDAFRGVPLTFKKAWQGMQLALKLGVKVTINTTITHQNLHSSGIKKLFNWATQNQVIINPIFACPAGRWQDNLKILITPKDRQYLDKLQKKSPYLRRDMNSNWFRFGCPAVKEVLYITPTGEVFACPFLHSSLGNVKKESLIDIRRRALKDKPVYQTYHQKCPAAEDRSLLKELVND